MSRRSGGGLEPSAPGAKVTRLELFYDLVFVFAFFSVSTTTFAHYGTANLVGGLLVLALLWFAWTSFAALGNRVRADHGIMPLVGFATMVAIFIASVSLGDAFDDDRGLSGDAVFASCYLLVRLLQASANWYVLRHEPHLRHALWKLALPPLLTTGLLLTGTVVPRRLFDDTTALAVQLALWAVGIAIAYVAGTTGPARAITIVSAGHWAERHAQIVLVAFGESIIALGSGPNISPDFPLTWPVIGAATLGIVLVISLWWGYSDARAIAAENSIQYADPATRAALARDAYTYLHLPMIAGIILLAVGLKRLLAQIADPVVGIRYDEPNGTDIAALYGGVLLYLLALFAFQIRTTGRFTWRQVTVLFLLAVLAPVAGHLSSFGALVLLTGYVGTVMVIGVVRDRHLRRQLHQDQLQEFRELESQETEWRRRRPGG